MTAATSSLDYLYGLPYALPADPPRSYCCWTLVVEARKALGLETPTGIPMGDYSNPSTATATALMQLSQSHTVGWRFVSIEYAQLGDLVLLGDELGYRHCAVYLDRAILHAVPGRSVLRWNWDLVKKFYPRQLILKLGD